LSSKVNAVSHLHSVEAKKIWPHYTLLPITNGVNLPFWISWNLRQLSPNFDPKLITDLPDEKIWQIHQESKQSLIDEIALGSNILFNLKQPIIVWARRFASYKQPELLFSDIERLKKIAESTSLPFQIVIAGKAHPSDLAGKNMIRDINQKIIDNNLTNKIVFLPHYNMTYAKYLTAGADIWLNTPTRGHEASGTSGMKAGGNGVLLCSTKDGWMDEVDWGNIGWIIDDNPMNHLYHLLESNILPTYYKQDDVGYSKEWVERMRKTIKVIWPQYSTQRMFSEYKKMLYGINDKGGKNDQK
jgi:starch phosphorylase